MRCIIHDASACRWLLFENPVAMYRTSTIHHVLPILERVEEEVHHHGLHAAGFISYEASPAFDNALHTCPPSDCPLLAFGIYKEALPISLDNIAGDVSPLDWRPAIEKPQYDSDIDQIKALIKAGDTYQVNYTFRLHAHFAGDPFSLFKQMQRAQQASYAAFVQTDEFAICSASPELFFMLDGEQITTRPMKGTMPRALTADADRRVAEALHTSEKNRAENLMIVDMMRNDLGRIAEAGSVRVPSLFNVEKYPTIWQMTSTVTARTQAPVWRILQALFPCASVTGAPKARTMEIIRELEATPRSVYTGTIGFISPGRTAQLNVAIRTVLVDKRRSEAEFGTGGGVTWASTSEGEFEECFVKARIVTDTRPEFELLETILFSKSGGFFLLDEHLGRLRSSAEYFDFQLDEIELQRTLDRIPAELSPQPKGDYRVRLMLNHSGTIRYDTSPLDLVQRVPVRLKLARTPVNTGDVFLYHKTTNRSVYDEAFASQSDCDDVILWNERREVTETTIANVVIDLKGELFTPPVESGLLAGTLRSTLLREGKISERICTLDDVYRADGVCLVNSLRGWRHATVVGRE